MSNKSPSNELRSNTTASAAQLYTAYVDLLQQHMPDLDAAKRTLQDPHAPLWQQLVSHLLNTQDRVLEEFLKQVYSTSEQQFPRIPQAAVRRPVPKTVKRLRRKLDTVVAPKMERSACADWVAMRIQAHVEEFEQVKRDLQVALGEDVAVAWRNEDVGAVPRRDIVVYGYAFRKGGKAVMEMQITEPVALWVVEMNTRAKHKGEPGCVTFVESKEFYEALKKVILDGAGKEALPNEGRVRDYYAEKKPGETLNNDELDKFQRLVDEILEKHSERNK